MDVNVWSLSREAENRVVKVKALALRSELARYGLTSEEKVKRAWEMAVREAVKHGNGSHVKITNVKFLNVYCLVEMEVSRGNGESP